MLVVVSVGGGRLCAICMLSRYRKFAFRRQVNVLCVCVCVCVAVSGTRRNMSATAVESRHRDNNDVSDVKWNDSGIVIGKPRPPAVYYSV